MKIAKASKEDIHTTLDFMSAMDNLFDSRGSSKEEEWKKFWDDEDPDKIALLKIQKELAEELDCDEESIDNDLILFRFIKSKFRRCEFNWRRVVFASDVLIDNVCDPTEDYLKYHPFIERATDESMLVE